MAKLSETIKTGAFGAGTSRRRPPTPRATSSPRQRHGPREGRQGLARDEAQLRRLPEGRAHSATAGAVRGRRRDGLLGLAGYARKPSMRARSPSGAGFAIGGGAAIFLAPVSGSTMRRKVRLFVRELLDDAPEAIQHAKDAVSNVKTDLKNVDLKNDLKKEAKHVVSDVKHVASEAKDAIKDRLPNGNGDLSPYRS